MSKILKQYAQKAKSWLQKEALPFWSNQGIDPARGFCEQAELSGSFAGIGDRQANKRILVQARQVYTFCHATQMELFSGIDVASQGVDFIKKVTQSQDQLGLPHKVSPVGKTIESSRQSYDHAFILLAMTWFQRVSQTDYAKKLIDETLYFFDNQLATEVGFLEAVPNQLPRRQNPHMHLFEALIALYKHTGKNEYLYRADAIFTMFEEIFYDREYKVLREFFDSEWLAYQQSFDYIEPGHLMEWVWLLRQYQQIRPQVKVEEYCQQLFSSAITLGYDPANKVLIDCVNPHGMPLLTSRRCWPQTEAIKASLAQWQCTGEESYAGYCADFLESLFKYYLNDCPSGCWRDKFDASMNNCSTQVPASTFYHLFVCFQQLIALSEPTDHQ